VFGLVTKRQLEQHAEDLRREVERSRADIDALKLEWFSMYDKFKMLLHRWTKRDKAAQGDGPKEEQPGTTELQFPRSRRGF
jgi:hypothetical protein